MKTPALKKTLKSSVLAATALGLGFALPSVSSLAAAPSTTAATALPRIAVTPQDFGVQLPAAVSAGPVTIQMATGNGVWHSFALGRLKAGVSDAKAQAVIKSGNYDALDSVITPYGGAVPGAAVIVTLPAGRYTLFDIEQGDKGKVLATSRFFNVAPSATPRVLRAPAVDGAVTLKDMKIKVSGPLPAGRITLKIANRGPSEHMFSTARILPGKTFQDVLAYLKQGPNAKGQPPIDPMSFGGLQPIGKGQTTYLTESFAPGSYVAMCFVTDMKKQIPHMAEGMITEFTVR